MVLHKGNWGLQAFHDVLVDKPPPPDLLPKFWEKSCSIYSGVCSTSQFKILSHRS